VGNHDLDFGQEVLLAHAGAASFPFLTASVTLADTGGFPVFAQPYVVREVNGVQVGIVGLTTTRKPHIVMPAFVGGLAPVAAELSIPLLGGYREAFPAGEITRADVVATLSFENTPVDVEPTGQQVMDNLLCCGGAVAGLTWRQGDGDNDE